MDVSAPQTSWHMTKLKVAQMEAAAAQVAVTARTVLALLAVPMPLMRMKAGRRSR